MCANARNVNIPPTPTRKLTYAHGLLWHVAPKTARRLEVYIYIYIYIIYLFIYIYIFIWVIGRATRSLENRHVIEYLEVVSTEDPFINCSFGSLYRNTASPTGSWSAATVLLSSLQNCRVQSTTLSHRAAMGGLLSAFEDMFAGLFRKILKGCSVSIRILCVGLFIGG